MTTQRLDLAPRRALQALRTRYWAQPVNVEDGDGCYPTKGDFAWGSMRGRKTNLRVPFDTFEAAIPAWPYGNQIVDGDTITLNDGRQTAIFEFDTDANVAPGHILVPFNPADTPALLFAGWWSELQLCLQYGELDLEAFALGPVPGATTVVFRSHRSHPGMYGWGKLWSTSNQAAFSVYGWGEWGTTGLIEENRRNNGGGRLWFPIRWGLSRGWTATEDLWQRPLERPPE